VDALVVDVLATYRLTHLVQRDKFPPVRKTVDAILAAPSTPERVVELLECPWCLSFWLGAGVMAARRLAPRWWGVVGGALAASAVTALVMDWPDR